MSNLTIINPARKVLLAMSTAFTVIALLSQPLYVQAAHEPANTHISRLLHVHWMQAAGKDLDCHVPGLGLERPVVRYHDITGDGFPDTFLVLRCRTGDSSAFDQLEVFDGASNPMHPGRLGILIYAPHSQNYLEAIRTGVKIKSISFSGSSVRITGRMFRSQDGAFCLGVLAQRTATWDGRAFKVSPSVTIQLDSCRQ